YDSFQPVVEFASQAARDPDVLAISITLFRAGRDTPMVDELVQARANGKQVTVVLEVKGDSDMEHGVSWSQLLQGAGANVVHGMNGLKVHSKLMLVARREGSRIRNYVHLSSGNYNAATAKLFSDFGMFTADDSIGADACALFDFL